MKTTLFTIACFAIATLGVFAEKAPKSETSILDILLEAIQSNDLKKFESVCGEKMKVAMTEENLKDVSEQVAPHIQEGFDKVYMGVLNHGETNTYLWKIDFKGEGVSDSLAELSTRNGEVVGFFIR
jgi:hypothetical protein